MQNILFDIDNNVEVIPMLENIKTFDEFLFEYLDVIQKLSGVIVIVDNKILLVKPKKFKKSSVMWSIPKGKLNKGKTLLDNALLELEEETGIKLDKEKLKNSEKAKVFYKKGKVVKELTTYIIKLNKDDLSVDMNKKWEVHKKHFDTDEVYKAKFFTKTEAIKKIESGQMPLLKFM